MAQYGYSFSNKVRSFTPMLRMLQEKKPTILSAFTLGSPDGKELQDTTFYYYDYIEQPVSALVNGALSATDTTVTIDNTVGTIAVGDMIAFKDASYEVRVVTAVSGADLTVAALTNDHADNTPIIRVGTPKAEGSSKSATDIDQATKRTNYTRIYRFDFELSGSAIALLEESLDTALDRGMAQKTMKLMREMGTDLVWSSPLAASSGVEGQTAGLLYWLNQSDSLRYDKGTNALTADHINAAVENVYNKGGDPDMIICNTAVARKISAMNSSTTNSMVIISADTDVGGGVRAVSQFTGDLAGTGTKKILVEPNMPDQMLALVTSSDLYLTPLKGRSLYDWDSTAADFDGVTRSSLGEYGTQIFNPYTAHALVYNFT